MAVSKKINLALDKKSKKPAPIDPKYLLEHSVILAQSGSGKSCMIGRLLEEIMLKTKAHIVILDPNSDFVRLPQPDLSVWKDKKLNKWLYPEETYKGFSAKWKDVAVIASNRNLENSRLLVLDWGALDSYEMAAISGIDVRSDSDLYWYLFLTLQIAQETWDGDVETYFDFEHFREQSEVVLRFITSGHGPAIVKENPLARILKRSIGGRVSLRFRAIVDSLAEQEIWRSKGDGETDVCDFVDQEGVQRALVVDLQSLSKYEARISVASRILTAIWQKRKEAHWKAMRDFEEPDTRVPLFLVIDEAHNLIPQQKTSPAIQRLAEEIIKIAAEGRKYGIFLIAATQRPRKLDSNVLNECDNLFLMKTSNDEDLKYIVKTLGFPDHSVAALAKAFEVGDIILAGTISSGNKVLHVSPRRTYQGGKSLSGNFWLKG